MGERLLESLGLYVIDTWAVLKELGWYGISVASNSVRSEVLSLRRTSSQHFDAP